MNDGGPRAPTRSRAAGGARAIRAVSRWDAHFLEGAVSGRPSFRAIHLQRFFKGIIQVIQKFLARLARRVDARVCCLQHSDPQNPDDYLRGCDRSQPRPSTGLLKSNQDVALEPDPWHEDVG